MLQGLLEVRYVPMLRNGNIYHRSFHLYLYNPFKNKHVHMFFFYVFINYCEEDIFFKSLFSNST